MAKTITTATTIGTDDTTIVVVTMIALMTDAGTIDTVPIVAMAGITMGALGWQVLRAL